MLHPSRFRCCPCRHSLHVLRFHQAGVVQLSSKRRLLKCHSTSPPCTNYPLSLRCTCHLLVSLHTPDQEDRSRLSAAIADDLGASSINYTWMDGRRFHIRPTSGIGSSRIKPQPHSPTGVTVAFNGSISSVRDQKVSYV